MRKDLKPGDICLITGGVISLANVGKSVELLIPVEPYDQVTLGDQTYFNNSYEHGLKQTMWIVQGDNLLCRNMENGLQYRNEGLALEQHLLKLGDGDVDQVRTKEKERPVTV